MKKENKESLIHVKLGYEEAIQGKRNVLSTEMNLLQLINSIKNYRAIRSQELMLKAKIHRKIKEFNTSVKKTKNALPEVKVPEILEKEYEETSEVNKSIKKKSSKKTKTQEPDLQSQIQDIQEKLRALSQ